LLILDLEQLRKKKPERGEAPIPSPPSSLLIREEQQAIQNRKVGKRDSKWDSPKTHTNRLYAQGLYFYKR
jgi:hypothetical protein